MRNKDRMYTSQWVVLWFHSLAGGCKVWPKTKENETEGLALFRSDHSPVLSATMSATWSISSVLTKCFLTSMPLFSSVKCALNSASRSLNLSSLLPVTSTSLSSLPPLRRHGSTSPGLLLVAMIHHSLLPFSSSNQSHKYCFIVLCIVRLICDQFDVCSYEYNNSDKNNNDDNYYNNKNDVTMIPHYIVRITMIIITW